MKTSYEMLLELKTNYSVFLGRKSFKELMIFSEGYNRCLCELFAEYQIGVFLGFSEYINTHYKTNFPNHNWKDIILFQCNLDDQYAFDEFYQILDSYLKSHPEIMEKEYERQKKYHELQLNKECEKVVPSEDYLTSGTVNDYLMLNKK